MPNATRVVTNAISHPARDATAQLSALNALVADSIDVVVHVTRHRGVPRVTEIVTLEEQQAGPGATAFTTTTVFGRARLDAPLVWTGAVPTRISRPLAEVGQDLRGLLGATHAPTATPTNAGGR